MKCPKCSKRVKRSLKSWLSGWGKAFNSHASTATKAEAEQRYKQLYGDGVALCKCGTEYVER